MARLSEYRNEYADTLLDCMSNGMLDCEVYTRLGICKNTFIRWRNEYPDFNDAYEIGLPRCEAWWVQQMKQKWLDGDDRGYRYCALIVKSKFGYNEKQIAGVTNNTQINVQGNVNVLGSKSTSELISVVQDNFDFIKDNNIIEAKFIDESSESDKQD